MYLTSSATFAMNHRPLELVSLILLIVLMTGCNHQQKEKAEADSKFPPVQNLADFPNSAFIPTLEHTLEPGKNSVYCATLLFAWDEIRKEIDQAIIVKPENQDLSLLNQSTGFLSVLKKGEYTTSVEIDGDMITARAEFSRSLPFPVKLTPYQNKLVFTDVPVASFGTTGYPYEHRQVAQIVHYRNDENFIVKLLPKDKEHEIILFMTDQPFSTMAEMVTEIARVTELAKEEKKLEKNYWKYWWNEEDFLVIPKFSFNIETNYNTIEGAYFSAGKRDFRVETAWQRTAFMLDESGAEIESEAEVAVTEEMEEDLPRPKRMVFDKPFLLIIKRKDATNPYFGLWVGNAELMVKE